MKVKVIKRFRDKYTNVTYPAGATISLSEERVNEILSAGNYLEKISSKKKSADPAPTDPAPTQEAKE